MARRPVVTEEDLRHYLARDVGPRAAWAGAPLKVVVARDAILTPAAMDFAREKGIEVVRGYAPGSAPAPSAAEEEPMVDKVVAAVLARLGPDAPRDVVIEAVVRVLERLGYTVRGR